MEKSLQSKYQPDGPVQIEIFRRMALLKANDERSRKEVITPGGC